MLVSAQVRYLDYSSRSLDRRTSRVGDRAEDERRKNTRRRPPVAVAPDDAPPEVQVLSAFRPRPPAAAPELQYEGVHPAAALSPTSLWSLIDAVDGGAAPAISPTSAQTTSSEPHLASQAESLYLLLAQVIGDEDEEDEDGSAENPRSHI